MKAFVGAIIARGQGSSRRKVVQMASNGGYAARRVLLTNDDGVSSPSLQMLRRELHGMDVAQATVVAPTSNQSACGQRITLSHKLMLTEHGEFGERVFSLDGSPSDCAILALDPGGIVHDTPPSLVISGINLGSNMSHDVLYSGTFAGARQAAMSGYPAIATSLTGERFSEDAIGPAVSATMQIVQELLKILPRIPVNPSRGEFTRKPYHLFRSEEDCEDVDAALLEAFRNGDIILNINTPPDWNGEFQCTTLAAMQYQDAVRTENDQMWLGEVNIMLMENNHADCDVLATTAGKCSITTMQTWPENHPFRVPDFLLREARRQRRNAMPLWVEEAVKMATV